MLDVVVDVADSLIDFGSSLPDRFSHFVDHQSSVLFFISLQNLSQSFEFMSALGQLFNSEILI